MPGDAWGREGEEAGILFVSAGSPERDQAGAAESRSLAVGSRDLAAIKVLRFLWEAGQTGQSPASAGLGGTGRGWAGRSPIELTLDST